MYNQAIRDKVQPDLDWAFVPVISCTQSIWAHLFKGTVNFNDSSKKKYNYALV